MPTPRKKHHSPLKTNQPPLRAAVIGSGFGGLAVAIRLQSQGIQTTLYEALPQLGGRAGYFEDQGYKFDMGPTVITAPDTLEELFTLSGRRLQDFQELIPLTPMYRLFWEDGVHFDYHQDEKKLLAEIKKVSPEDVAHYDEYFSYCMKVFQEGYVKLCHVPFQSFWDMAKVAPKLLQLSAQLSVYSKVKTFFKSEKIRQAFSFNSLLIGGHPFRASAIYSLIHPLERAQGVHWAKGGTHSLVSALGRLFREIGGTIKTNARVDTILTENDQVTGVRLDDGHQQRFDMVISNGDVVQTYRKLLRHHTPSVKVGEKLTRKSHSMSLFVMYFGTNRKFPGILHHNVMFGPRYKDLLDDIFDRGIVADDFSLYLHAPSLSDPSMAPEGGETFYVLAPVPHLGPHAGQSLSGHSPNGSRSEPYDWKNKAQSYGDRIIDYLDQRYLPGLKQSIVVRHHMTPLDFESKLDAFNGAAFSLEPILTQSAYFRIHNRDDRLKGLYFVGAGTHPGAGIPGVVGSAKATAHVIFNDYAKDLAYEQQPSPNKQQWAPTTP